MCSVKLPTLRFLVKYKVNIPAITDLAHCKDDKNIPETENTRFPSLLQFMQISN